MLSILTALQNSTASRTQQMQDEVKTYEQTIKDKKFLEVCDENVLTAFAPALHLQFRQSY